MAVGLPSAVPESESIGPRFNFFLLFLFFQIFETSSRLKNQQVNFGSGASYLYGPIMMTWHSEYIKIY